VASGFCCVCCSLCSLVILPSLTSSLPYACSYFCVLFLSCLGDTAALLQTGTAENQNGTSASSEANELMASAQRFWHSLDYDPSNDPRFLRKPRPLPPVLKRWTRTSSRSLVNKLRKYVCVCVCVYCVVCVCVCVC
jgi:hypothetical protein